MGRVEVVSLESLKKRQSEARLKVAMMSSALEIVERKLRVAESEYWAAEREATHARDTLAGLNGLIDEMEKVQAVKYISEGGSIQHWILEGGKRVVATPSWLDENEEVV